METTIVTAFFDINRSTKGDGRTIEEYKEWIIKTLQLNCNLFIITEEKFKHFFILHRPTNYNTIIKIIEFKDSYFYKYYNDINRILNDNNYKNKISYPNRVECVLPEYNILQYSKFHYLQMAINDNPFNSNYFFWLDAGGSRFFLDVDITKPYPSENTIIFLKNNDKFIIENRSDIYNYVIDDNFIWKADNLLIGGLFGGSISIINKMFNLIENIFLNEMINKNNINNEQLALALIYNDNPQLFYLINSSPYYSLFIFKILSL
jgi:hypothetical protein